MAGGKKNNKTEPKGKDPVPAKGGKGAKGGAKGGKEEQKQPAKGKTGGQWVIARHILCAKQSKLEEAIQKLEEAEEGGKNGRDAFAAVARDYSEDKARQGGLLGKQTKGGLFPEFEAVAYELQITGKGGGKAVTGRCKTSEGYHLIMVEDRG